MSQGYRSAATTPRAVRDLDFGRLPPAVRDRLARALGQGAPEALLAAPSGRPPLALRGALAVAIAAGLGVCGLFLSELGDIRGKHALQPASWAAGYAALLAAGAIAVGAFAALRRFQRGAPFRSGRYLLSLDMIEANGGRLRVTSLDTLRGVEARGRQVIVTFEDGHTALFPAGRKENPADLAAQVDGTVARARKLVYPADEAKLARLDPFFEVRVTEDWESAAPQSVVGSAAEPGSSPSPARSRIASVAAAAAVAAAPAGYGLLAGRNAVSDGLMFDDARTERPGGESVTAKTCAYARTGRRHVEEAARLCIEGTGEDRRALTRYAVEGGALGALADDALFALAGKDPDQLVRYLRRGGPRRDEADDALFAVARQMDTADAYNDYLAVGARHADEVRRDLLPDADYRRAARSYLVGSLFSFVRRSPGSRHEDEAWASIRRTYAEALPAYQASHTSPPEGLRFVQALLPALLERADPRVALDIRIADPTAITEADTALGAVHGRLYVPAAPSFSREAMEDLRRDTRSEIAAWFGQVFSHGVAEISRSSDDDEARPRFDVVCTPVVDGTSRWQKPGATEPARVTALIGFAVEITGRIFRDGKETTISWKTHLDDTTNGKMTTRDFRGQRPSVNRMSEDAFGPFLSGVPARVGATFGEHL